MNKSKPKNAYSYKWGVIGIILSLIALATGAAAIIGFVGLIVSIIGLGITRKKNKMVRQYMTRKNLEWK